MNKKDVNEKKAFQLVLSKELWVFLKTQSIIQEKCMSKIIISLVEGYMKKIDK